MAATCMVLVIHVGQELSQVGEQAIAHSVTLGNTPRILEVQAVFHVLQVLHNLLLVSHTAVHVQLVAIQVKEQPSVYSVPRDQFLPAQGAQAACYVLQELLSHLVARHHVVQPAWLEPIQGKVQLSVFNVVLGHIQPAQGALAVCYVMQELHNPM